ncbi:putative carbamoyl-phosphate synthase L chain-1 [Elsinoe australis]|uniref:Putative carbamoyl-phosphate synthase L chain-1 n=1 Tax=Elsinoe australis TaxID=40998 RepID=A0A4U7AX02_9PEZI|nr:putative carbamoyl-phosphate synthase L chain-1 [Elsinoe australis]
MPPAAPKPIKRLLVANRGEIATRIISAARELDIETIALYTGDDVSHAYNANHAVELSGPFSYLDIDELLSVAKKHSINAVHPGYGFLSESAEFAKRLADAGIAVVGPGYEILDRTGDKLQARKLAEECSVPVLPALTTPTSDSSVVKSFAQKVGLPIMIKAVDGGGGRGIRLVEDPASLEGLLVRAIDESPSKQVFVEKAAVQGYRHIEVQIAGDYHGNVTHLWERECSIQRRYQKIVELAPSSLTDRKLIARVIEATLRMAKKINYKSLGTFEFLVNPESSEFYFLEINPRLQVEHTVTESVCSTDIVGAQLLIAQGASLQEAGLEQAFGDPERPPPLVSVQLRITAEDPSKNWSLSVGKIQSSHFPSGNGIRCDTNIVNGIPSAVTADFDSLIAKLIITASTWPAVLAKARRALEDTHITGIQTNIPILKAIVAHPDFISGTCTTSWLESQHASLLSTASQPSPKKFGASLFASPTTSIPTSSPSSSQLLFRKDDAWTIALAPLPSSSTKQAEQQDYHLHLTRLLKNDFPASLSAEITITPTSSSAEPASYRLALSQTSMSSSAAASASSRPRADPRNKTHVPIPFAGKLVEVLVEEGDEVREGETLFVVRQMKMELEVRAGRAGRVEWVMEGEEGEDVGEGWLGAVIIGQEEGERGRAKL